MLKEQVGISGLIYYPMVNTIFIFILMANLIGLTPFGYTVTSQVITTFLFGVTAILGLFTIGLIRHNIEFVNLFIPKDIPKILLPLLIVIETISYFSRMFSLSIRLFANLMSGHVLLNILSGFGVALGKCVICSVIPLAVMFAVTFLELCIAFLQAYVFAVLICIYLNEAFEGGH